MADTADMKALCAIAAAQGIDFRDDSPPRSFFIPANGLRMHGLDWGRGDRPTVLFLHGAGMTAHTWDLVCLHLRKDYHCIALDQRGHGLTDGVHAFGVEQPREDIAGAVAALGLDRFVLVGMSLGGNNAIAWAGLHSGQLAGLVLVDVCPTVLPTGYQDMVAYSKAIAATRSFDEAVAAAHGHNPRGSIDYKRHTLSHSLEERADGHWQLRNEREPPPADMQGADYMKRRREALWALVPQIACPVLAVHGADSLAQDRQTMDQLCAALPDGRLIVIPGASHDVQEDQPLALARALRSFLDEIGH